jgi:hypothetical protein
VERKIKPTLVSWQIIRNLLLAMALAASMRAGAQQKVFKNVIVGDAERLEPEKPIPPGAQWESSAPQIIEIFQNGYVIGLKPGQARITARSPDGKLVAEGVVDARAQSHSLVDAATLIQYPDDRKFVLNGDRLCYGSQLNGQRAVTKEEKKFTRSNRVINPNPLRADKPLYWEVKPGTEVFDGAGALLGTVSSALQAGDRRVLVSMFNFGASKILHGRICIYAFSVQIKPSPRLAAALDPGEEKEGRVGTSAWLPLDDVVEKEKLLERIGLGRERPLDLRLDPVGMPITGGNPKQYLTQYGELRIIRGTNVAAVPSHYLRRPSGTINLVYSVPGFGLGGEGGDSFLISDGLKFYPAPGAKVFTRPTYFPPKHPQAGKVAPQTMTFVYGAIKAADSEPAYGWVAREALASGGN